MRSLDPALIALWGVLAFPFLVALIVGFVT